MLKLIRSSELEWLFLLVGMSLNKSWHLNKRGGLSFLICLICFYVLVKFRQPAMKRCCRRSKPLYKHPVYTWFCVFVILTEIRSLSSELIWGDDKLTVGVRNVFVTTDLISDIEPKTHWLWNKRTESANMLTYFLVLGRINAQLYWSVSVETVQFSLASSVTPKHQQTSGFLKLQGHESSISTSLCNCQSFFLYSIANFWCKECWVAFRGQRLGQSCRYGYQRAFTPCINMHFSSR